MIEKVIENVNFTNPEHCEAVVSLINEYMLDDMGLGEPLPYGLDVKLIEGLKNHNSYLGFLVKSGTQYVGLANCNMGFSTWKAKPLLNIHDLIVATAFRGQGIGRFLLQEVENYARKNNYCRINLEVRQCNIVAQNLYKKAGYGECQPPNFFWEKIL